MSGILLDSNIFLRFLVNDVPLQYSKAKETFYAIEQGKETGLVSILVINEIIWVLERFYQMKRDVYIPLLLNLLALKNIKIIEAKKEIIVEVLQKMEKFNFAFTDVYLVDVEKNKTIISFDKDITKLKKTYGRSN